MGKGTLKSFFKRRPDKALPVHGREGLVSLVQVDMPAFDAETVLGEPLNGLGIDPVFHPVDAGQGTAA